MAGVVEWQHLLTLVGVIISATISVAGFSCFLLYRALKQLGDMRDEWNKSLIDTRHTINSKVEQGRVALEDKIEEAEGHAESRFYEFDIRLRKVESEHVLVMALREDFRALAKDLTDRIEQNRIERRQDLSGLHSRINELLMLPPRHGSAAE